jgi:predicted DNA-binding WGR domain protein
MKHYLTFKDEKSNKFWQIEASGKSFTVTYGKSGTAGSSQTKTFGSESECQKEAEKLLNEKLKKGYAPGSDIATQYLKTWEEIVNSALPAKAFKNHLLSIGVTDRMNSILEKFCDSITSITIAGGRLRVILPWEYNKQPVTLEFLPPHTGKFDKSVPESFRKFYKAHNGVVYFHDERNESFSISGVDSDGLIDTAGTWDSAYIEEADNEDVINYLEGKGKSVADVISFGVYDECQNWYLLHPKKKNKAGEPAIVLFDHGSCDMNEDVSDFTLPDFIIQQLAQFILSIRDQSEKSDTSATYVSNEFSKFLRSAVEESEEEAHKKLLAVEWEEEAGRIYKSIIQYWAGLAKGESDPIGIFDIRWDDGANMAIEFDYEKNNDLEMAMEDGCIRNTPVVDFEDFFRDTLGLSEPDFDEEGFEVVKNVVCRLSQELIIQTTSSKEFGEIKKRDPHYIQFAHWHDEAPTVIFDSSGTIQNPFEKKKEEDSAGDMLSIFMEYEFDPKMFEHELKLLYNKNNAYLKTGKYAQSKNLVVNFTGEFREMEDGKAVLCKIKMSGEQSGSEMNFLESLAADVLVLSLMTKDQQIEELAMELMPETITDGVLAFNLSCLYATKRDKPKLLNFTRIAIGLGKRKDEFMVDSDFDFYKKDPDFLSILS